jgi:alpha-mannosidase
MTVTTTVGNLAKDHRLRVAFPTGLRSDTVTVAEHFDVLSRPVEFPSGEPVKNQPPQHMHHCDEFVSVCEGTRGVTLLNRGLPEYQARHDGKKVTLVQTLMRCVGGVGAGANLPVPEAQCPGEHTFQYAILLHNGSAETAQVWNDAAEYTTPAFRHMLEEKDDGTEAARASLFLVEDPRVAVSAIKESRGGFLLRLWNPSSEPVKPVVRTGFDIAAAAITNMLERPQRKLPFEARRVKLASLAPKEIVTLWLRPAKRGPQPASPYGRPDVPAGFRSL